MPPIERPSARADDSAEAEEPIVPIAQLVEQQRARMDRLLALSLEERSALIAGVERNGNGSDSDH